MLKTKYQQNHNRICNSPDCEELGIYPAPKSRNNLKEYYYFCIDCVRAFNKSWNYFAGLNEEELEVEIRKSVTWDRPSWKFSNKTINNDFEKAFKFFDEQKKIKKNKVIDKKLENCFKVLELNSDSTLKEIKSRYKIQAKKWHPDTQNSVASPNNKDKFIDISNAYKTILKTFTKLETKK